MLVESAEKIYTTSDYDLFKFLLGNRSPDSEAKIIDSIKSVGVILDPILVNEKYEIIDGQNRFRALKTLNLPINFMIQEGIGINECRHLNIGRTNWTQDDYVYSFAENGNANYQRMASLLTEFKKNFGSCQNILAYAKPNSLNEGGCTAHKTINEGTLILSDGEYELAATRLNSAVKLGFVSFGKRRHMNKRIYHSCVSYIYQNQDVNAAEIIAAMEEYESIIPSCNRVSEQLRFIDDAVNRGRRRGKDKVFMSADFQKRRWLDGE